MGVLTSGGMLSSRWGYLHQGVCFPPGGGTVLGGAELIHTRSLLFGLASLAAGAWLLSNKSDIC